ncbi:MAG TPA: hypothetical protein VHQ02_05525 [Usitatibacter sp.]|nr:hypothetical protein [Usitatibacter sp.]
MKPSFVNAPAFLAMALAGCAVGAPYGAPWSVIQTDVARSADPLVIPVIVNRVDDRNARPDNTAVVAPGLHRVTVDVPPRKGFKTATQHTFELAAEPCTRYYVAARLENRALQEWTPFVRSRERIGECEAKFGPAR